MPKKASPEIIFFLASLLLNGAVWLAAMFFPRHESAAILHYTSNDGIDFIGEGAYIFLLPAIGALILVLNIGVGHLASRSDKRTAWVLWGTTPFVQVLLLISLIFLIGLNR